MTKSATPTVATQSLSPSSSGSISVDEYVALCLIKLARGDNCSTQTTERSYDCSVCGKGFPSHQALGGHKSSHRRPTSRVRPTASESSSGGSRASLGSGQAHECNVCGRVFLTGQALGGHKRRHYLEGSSSGSGFRGFDLNLPPPMIGFGFKGWMDEGEDEVQSPMFKKPRLVITS